MRRGLIIFFAVMALMFSVVLCACENDATTPNGVTLEEDNTTLTSETGIVVSGDTFPTGTTIVFNTISDDKIIDEVTQLTKSSDHYLFGDNYVVSIVKVIDLSLYDGTSKLEVSKRLDYEIPTELLGVDKSNCNQYHLFRITEKNQVKFIDATRWSNSFSFTSSQSKYLVVVKWEMAPCKHVNIGEFDDGYPATIFSSGLKPHYYCWDCRKYLDENMNETTWEELIIPKLSRNLDLYVNGEKKSEFSLSIEEARHLKWEINGISLKAGDSISIVTRDDSSIFSGYEPKVITNINENGQVRNDVAAATIELEVNRSYSDTVWLRISGAEYYYVTLSNYKESETRGIGLPDENGNISFNKVLITSYSGTIYVWKYENGQISACDILTINDGTSSTIGSLYTSDSSFYVYNSGYYRVSYNINSKNLAIDTISIIGDKLASYRIKRIDNTKLDIRGVYSKGRTIDSCEDCSVYFEKYLAADENADFVLENSPRIKKDLSVAADSKNYISFDKDTGLVHFLQYGSYDIYVSEMTYEIRVEYKGDATPDYKGYIYYNTIRYSSLDHPYYTGSPYEAYPNHKIELNTTEDSNVLAFKKAYTLYSGMHIYVQNEKEDRTNYYQLGDIDDLEYAEIVGTSLIIKKNGVYNIFFNTSTKTIDLEFVRELANSELLQPSKYVLGLYKTNSIELKRVDSLIENSNDKDEMCILSLNITEKDMCLIFVADCEGEFADQIDTRQISDISLSKAYDNIEIVNNQLWGYGAIRFKETGKYYIYINKLTHVVRVEEVVEA